MREITVKTDRHTQLIDITSQVREALDGQTGAAVLVYVPHTTAGVTINEHADPLVARDFEMALERIVPEEWSWQHIEEGEENAPVAPARLADGAAGARAVPRRRARAGHVAGHLLLRVRRAAHALGLRQRPPIGGRRASSGVP